MSASLDQWVNALALLLAVWFILMYSDRQLNDVKALLRREIETAKAEVRIEQTADKKEILEAIADLKGDVPALDRRLQRLEAPLLLRS